MVKAATPRQTDLLRFIRGYQLANGYSPSFTQIMRGTGLASKSSVHRLLSDAEQRRLVRRLYCKERAIDVLVEVAVPIAPDGAPLFMVPGFGGRC